jgi:CRISPR/Cas system CMR-associated protein Cmr5 small subunit
MVDVIDYNENFYDLVHKVPGKIVAYGLGNTYKVYGKKMEHIDYLCDKNAKSICKSNGFDNISNILTPSELEKINEQLYIVVFIENNDMYLSIVEELRDLKISAKVTSIYDNCAFSDWLNKYIKRNVNDKRMRINIVCRKDGWIFTKFAEKLYSCLENEQIDVTISDSPRRDVDLNHHIPYLLYEPYTNDTLMITHVDCRMKLDRIKKQLERARVGICMSKQTRDTLIMLGISADKLCYINPAQDNIIKPKKYGIGITHRCYDRYDVRKRASAIIDVLDGINPAYFKIYIMGAGWDDIVLKLQQINFEVVYYNDFQYEIYLKIMNSIDYYLYMGFDEGSMGYLDAMASGVGTIITPQGFHLDTHYPIDYPCTNIKEFHNAFVDLQSKREERIKAVSDWSWHNYAMKHVQLWKYILRIGDLKELYANQLLYEDGLYSLLVNNVEI